MPSMRVPLEAWVNARQPVLSAHRKLQVPFRLLLCFQFPTRECLPGRAGRHRYGCRTMLLPRRGGLGASSVCREGRQRASVVVEVEHLAGKGRQGMARSLLACLLAWRPKSGRAATDIDSRGATTQPKTRRERGRRERKNRGEKKSFPAATPSPRGRKGSPSSEGGLMKNIRKPLVKRRLPISRSGEHPSVRESQHHRHTRIGLSGDAEPRRVAMATPSPTVSCQLTPPRPD